MKSLVQFLTEASHRFIINKHSSKNLESELSISKFKDILKNNEYVILIRELHYKDINFVNGKYIVSKVFVLEAGDNTIANKYGQPTYYLNCNIQDIDGDWDDTNSKFSLQNNVLKDFQERSGIQCCKRVNKIREANYEVSFLQTNKITNFDNIKFYDYR